MSEKKVPNPDGKKGGEAHRKKVQEVFDEVEKRGLVEEFERYEKIHVEFHAYNVEEERK